VRQTKEGVQARLKDAARRHKVKRKDLLVVVVSCPDAAVSQSLEGVVGRALRDAGWTLLRARDARRKG
jgi:hypothetical protein